MLFKLDSPAFIYLFWASRSTHLRTVSSPKKSYLLFFNPPYILFYHSTYNRSSGSEKRITYLNESAIFNANAMIFLTKKHTQAVKADLLLLVFLLIPCDTSGKIRFFYSTAIKLLVKKTRKNKIFLFLEY